MIVKSDIAPHNQATRGSSTAGKFGKVHQVLFSNMRVFRLRRRRNRYSVKPVDTGGVYLRVTVVKGRNLYDTVHGKETSPYVVLRANGYRFSTYTVSHGNEDPEWNTEFLVPLANWKRSPVLSIIVWNKLDTEKNYIGEAIVRLPGLTFVDQGIRWFSLTNSQSDSKTLPGDLGIRLSLGSSYNSTDNVPEIWKMFVDNFGGPELPAAGRNSTESSSSTDSTNEETGPKITSKLVDGTLTDNADPLVGSLLDIAESGLADDLIDDEEYDFDETDTAYEDPRLLMSNAIPGTADNNSLTSDNYSEYVTDSALEVSESEGVSGTSVPSDKLSDLTLAPPPVNTVDETGRHRHRTRHRRKKKKDKSSRIYQLNMDTNVLGMLFMEIESVSDLPPYRNMTRTNFDMDPFVVISFGKKTFRTPYRRHTLNPVFNEKLMFPVQKHEQGFSINFSVLDKDRLTLNDFVADVDLPVKDMMKTAPEPDAATGLYHIENPGYSSASSGYIGYKTFSVPLRLKKVDKYGEKFHPWITLRASFKPYTALRQRLWRGLADVYDADDTGGLNIIELSTMLDSLGSTLSEGTKNGFYYKFGKDPTTEELTVEEVVICLEEQLVKLSVEEEFSTEEVASNTAERVLQVAVCPFCAQPRLSKKTELDIVSHLATCATTNWAKMDALIMGRFVTSRQARKRWYSKVVSKVSYGNYRLGANSANILVQDRITGQIQEEKMSVYVRVGIRLLYKGMRSSHMEGKRIRNLLRALSIKQGRKFDDATSVQSILPFIKFHKLNMTDVLEPVENFKTFNEFFYRKLKPTARPCESPKNPRVAVSAADCRTVVFSTIQQAQEIWIKGRSFSISRLIGSVYSEHVDRYAGGALAIFRLAPQDYHRFHSPVDGILGEPKLISGEYYTVNPMAIRSSLDVYGENVRVVVPIQTEEFGLVIVCCIGAMMVGSTVMTAKSGERISRTDELGYFKFGGSTLVVIFEPNQIVFDDDLLNNSKSGHETLVRVGMSIGHIPGEQEPEHNYELHYK